MNFLDWFLNESFKKKYSFSSVQVNLPSNLSKQIIKFGKSIPNKEIYEKEGREDEIHITVLYGIHTTSYLKVFKLFKDLKPFKCKLGKTSCFETETYDVLKIDVHCPKLHKLNKLLTENVKYTNKYPKYIPHVTIAYLKSGKGKKYIDDSTFEGTEFIVDNMVFSSSNGKKYVFNF